MADKKRPTILFFAGPNGSGKSTITSSFETVLSSSYKIKILRKAKKEGYFIKGFFVLTSSPQINIERIKSRVAEGGHGVEEEKVITRYWKSLSNINELLELCDILHVYDNSTDKPVRIIRKHKQDISIFPNSIWNSERVISLMNGDVGTR